MFTKSVQVRVASAALAGCAAVAAFAPTASARPAYSSDTFYYSDASMTVLVGTYLGSCAGRGHQTGQVTPYAEETDPIPC